MEIRKYMENLIDTTKKILDRISEFEKTASGEGNIQKPKHFCKPTT